MATRTYFVEKQACTDMFAVLGPNPDAGKDCVPYSGEHLTICTTDGAEDAELIASALNAYRGDNAESL